MNPNQLIRSGALLVIVTGIVAMLFGLAVTFLFRIRNDAEEVRQVLTETQSRIMLMAGCSYILEAGRVGYDTYGSASRPAGIPSEVHEECYGWCDVRDGSTGPNTEDWNSDGIWDPRWSSGAVEPTGEGGAAHPGLPAMRPAWPAVNAAVRCPMFVEERPPYAIELTTAYNPINAVPSSDPLFGMPYERNADPRPVAGTSAAFVAGDPWPRAHTLDKAWFRVYRDGLATFVISCGSGGTRGFKHWEEVVAQGMEHEYMFDRGLFDLHRERESILQYRVEWSGAVPSPDRGQGVIFNEEMYNWAWDYYLAAPKNSSHLEWWLRNRSQVSMRNHLGTIRWIQRLREVPALW
jgi:hypothetical protein